MKRYTCGSFIRCLTGFVICLAPLLTQVVISSGTPLSFYLSDPAGDDHGAGNIRYPSDKLFRPGSFDITGLHITKESDMVRFRISMNAPVQPPPAIRISENIDLRTLCREKFFLQNIDIYIDTGVPSDPGATWLLPGRGATLVNGARWTRLIVMTPRPEAARSKLIRLLKNGLIQHETGKDQPKRVSPHDIEKQAEFFVKKRIFFASHINVKHRDMDVAIPLSWFGNQEDISLWKVLVTITGASWTDSFDIAETISGTRPEGNLLVREITPLGGSRTFGGAAGLPGESNLIDITTPPGFSQEAILSRFSKGYRCRIPMVSLRLLQSP